MNVGVPVLGMPAPDLVDSPYGRAAGKHGGLYPVNVLALAFHQLFGNVAAEGHGDQEINDGGHNLKIAYICDFFHPYAGYQTNIISKYWTKFGHEVYVITSEMSKMPRSLVKFFGIDEIEVKDRWFREKYGVEVIRIPLIAYLSGRSIYKSNIYKVLERIDPDVVFVNGNDSLIAIQLIKNYSKFKFGLVTDSHMLEMASKNCFNKIFRMYYRHFITPKILKYNIPVIRTQDDNYVDECLGIPIEKCPWISFGTDMMLFKPNKNVKEKFRKEHNMDDKTFIVLYAGKIIESKGANILAKAMQKVIATKREVVFLIVGTTEGEYGAYIENEFMKSKYRIIRLHTQKYFELPTVYQSADIAIYPKQCSMSFFDVQACGLPVIFEDNNINIARSRYQNAMTYKTGDIKDFCDKIALFANMSKKEYEKYSMNAIKLIKCEYDYAIKAKEYIPYLELQAKVKGKIKGEIYNND